MQHCAVCPSVALPCSASVRPGRVTSQIQAPTNSEDISTQNYYNPSMDRRQAEYILQQAQVDGAFVVRNSSKVPGEYSMSLFYQGHVRHLRIRRRNDNMFALGEQKNGRKVLHQCGGDGCVSQVRADQFTIRWLHSADVWLQVMMIPGKMQCLLYVSGMPTGPAVPEAGKACEPRRVLLLLLLPSPPPL
eukprot:scpid66186/ scgid5704/ Tyrosine-protein kinase shark